MFFWDAQINDCYLCVLAAHLCFKLGNMRLCSSCIRLCTCLSNTTIKLFLDVTIRGGTKAHARSGSNGGMKGFQPKTVILVGQRAWVSDRLRSRLYFVGKLFGSVWEPLYLQIVRLAFSGPWGGV